MYKTSLKANTSSIKNPVFLAEIQEKLKIYVYYIQGVSKKRGPFFKIDIIPLFIMESFQNFVCL